MESLQELMTEYRKQMQKGIVPRAYRGLMDTILKLKTHFKTRYPEYDAGGSLYFGYMDMTYFALFPKKLRERGLKIAIVFVHATCQFELWLAATNKQVQKKTWQLMKDNQWDKYPLLDSLEGEDAILIAPLVKHPDFGDEQAMTKQIEAKTVQFIHAVEEFLVQQ